MTNCPCCSDLPLLHTRAGKLYMLCQGCRVEVPVESNDPVVAASPTQLLMPKLKEIVSKSASASVENLTSV
jgi:hypothetical protein